MSGAASAIAYLVRNLEARHYSNYRQKESPPLQFLKHFETRRNLGVWADLRLSRPGTLGYFSTSRKNGVDSALCAKMRVR